MWTVHHAWGVQVPSVLGSAQDDFGGHYSTGENCSQKRCRVRVFLSNTGQQDVQDVCLSVHTIAPIMTEEPSIVVGTVLAGVCTPKSCYLEFTCDNDIIPSSTEV
jgi:hypothetical protein